MFSSKFLQECTQSYAECYEAETALLASYEQSFQEICLPAYRSVSGRKRAEQRLLHATLGCSEDAFERSCFEIAQSGALHVFAYDSKRWRDALTYSVNGLLCAEALYSLRPAPAKLVWSYHVASYLFCLPRDLERLTADENIDVGELLKRLIIDGAGRLSRGHATVAILRSKKGEMLRDIEGVRERMYQLGVVSDSYTCEGLMFSILAAHGLLIGARDLLSKDPDLSPSTKTAKVLLGYLCGRGPFTGFFGRLGRRIADFLPAGVPDVSYAADFSSGIEPFRALCLAGREYLEQVDPLIEAVSNADRDASVQALLSLRKCAMAISRMVG